VNQRILRTLVGGWLVVVSGACGAAMQAPVQGGAHDHPVVPPPAAGTKGAPPNAAARPVAGTTVSAADVKFMSGMIPHHAQAVIMAGWAASHGARSDVRILCERIVVGQRDEIALMRTWLSDKGQVVPDATSTRMKMMMDGMEHDMLMPGMLSDAEMAQLDRARGAEFDRLFLIGMIKHHQGAVGMVDELFASYGAAQDEVVFRFASDVYADQSTEIDRMEKMLAASGGGLLPRE
jgi:uncharacterized protein (DUF305 family)